MYFIQNPHQSRVREIITHQIQVRTEQKWYMRFSIPRRKYCRLFLCWCKLYTTGHHFFFLWMAVLCAYKRRNILLIVQKEKNIIFKRKFTDRSYVIYVGTASQVRRCARSDSVTWRTHIRAHSKSRRPRTTTGCQYQKKTYLVPALLRWVIPKARDYFHPRVVKHCNSSAN